MNKSFTLNKPQEYLLKKTALEDLKKFRELFEFFSHECVRILLESDNYDCTVIDWSIDIIEQLSNKIRNAENLLKGLND